MKKKFFISIICMLPMLTALSQEGMWMLTQMEQLNLSEKGLEIPIEEIYNPDKPCIANAILELGGGSASFVSSKGLVVTNHHVAFTALQRASSVNSNYLEDGFLAKDFSEEIQGPGYQASLMIGLKDVTKDVLKAAKGISDPVERDKKINMYIAELTAEVSADGGDKEAEVAPMYNGKQYIMYTYKVFKDIRIVYAPPSSIGNYGGEIDNWMWPRHTGDFSFMRVYVNAEGEGAEYSEDNVPYEPEVWLKVAEGDLDEGDFNFIMGYPGFTTRYRTSTSVDWNQNFNYPFSIKNFGEIISIMEELTADDPEGQLKVANLSKGLANAMKNFQGKVEGMKRTHFLQSKIDFETEFLAWANGDPKRKEKYASVLAKEKEQYDIIDGTKTRNMVFNNVYGLSGTLLSVATQIYEVTKELEKPVEERQPGLTADRIEEMKERLVYNYNDYYEAVDKALLVRTMKMADELGENERIDGLDKLLSESGKTAEEWVEEAYANTKMKDIEYARGLIGKSSTEIEETGDPFIKLAMSIYPMSEVIAKENEAFGATVVALRKEYMDALYEWQGTNMYPDANRTIRFTWGPVKGYAPADAVWYNPFTSLQGVLDKNTGEDPFNAPVELVELREKEEFGQWADPDLNDVPVAFLNQCDITGGNSGSPVLNAKGEIIGVAFDGNYEAMISDWQYDYVLQRCIAVDIRYVLWVTEKFGKAGFLLEEMGVSPK